MIAPRLSDALAVKLASLVVHCQEARSPKAHNFDFEAIDALANDPEVKEWIGKINPTFLPVKR